MLTSVPGKSGFLAGVLGSALLCCALAAGESVSAAPAPPAESREVISRAEQPELDRPELEKLKQGAAEKGISLAAAIDELAAKRKAPGDATLPDLEIDDLSLVELADLRLLARERGMSLEAAIDRYGWEDLFLEVTEKIFARFPGQRAGAAIVDTPDGGRGGWIAFKDAIPDEAVKLARTLPVAVELVGGKGYTEEELEKETARVVEGLPDGVFAAVGYDVRTGEVLIRAKPKAAPENGAAADALKERLRPAASANPRIGFRVVLTEEAPAVPRDGWLRGGGTLDTTGGKFHCTVGFNIYKNSLRSPSTAGHCARKMGYANLVYVNHSGDGGSTTIGFKLHHEGSQGDFARYGPGGMTSTDTFYYNWNSKRYVDRVATYAMTNVRGKTLCHFGAASGASCAEVENVGVTVTYTDGQVVSRLVEMDDCTDAKGDSGGPWYWGGNAYGIHAAKGSGDLCYFSQARLIPNALEGWAVVTR